MLSISGTAQVGEDVIKEVVLSRMFDFIMSGKELDDFISAAVKKNNDRQAKGMSPSSACKKTFVNL